MKAKIVLSYAIFVFLIYIDSNLTGYAQIKSNCHKWVVEFDASSIEAIILKPEEILADMDKFWDTNEAYKQVKWWHELRHQPINNETYRSRIMYYCDIVPELRTDNPSLLLTKRLMQAEEDFKFKAIPHVCSFLPDRDMKLISHIYFTAAISTSAFAISSEEDYLVISITDPYWEGSFTTIQNAMVHEMFHTGYNQNLDLWRDAEFPSEISRSLLTKLHTEGMATYTAYRATSIFPAPAEKDFPLIEDLTEVKNRLIKLNKLFRKSEMLRPEQLQQESWEIGVEQRAFYVMGAFMAKTIDENAGREVLIESLEKGSLFFLQTYNELVEKSMKLYDFQKLK